jgi:hypothetical protein
MTAAFGTSLFVTVVVPELVGQEEVWTVDDESALEVELAPDVLE